MPLKIASIKFFKKIFLWKIDAFWLLFDPKNVYLRGILGFRAVEIFLKQYSTITFIVNALYHFLVGYGFGSYSKKSLFFKVFIFHLVLEDSSNDINCIIIFWYTLISSKHYKENFLILFCSKFLFASYDTTTVLACLAFDDIFMFTSLEMVSWTRSSPQSDSMSLTSLLVSASLSLQTLISADAPVTTTWFNDSSMIVHGNS